MAERGPDARVIAGGHSLLPMMKLRLANPELLIDLNDLEGQLAYIREQDGQVRIGALTRHYQLLESELLARHFPLFADAEHVIADPVVRNRGTIGGSLAQADAAEDLSAVCSALKAETVIRGARRRAGRGDGGLPRRPVHDRDRRRRGAHRDPDPGARRAAAAPTRRSSGGPGDWAIVAVAGAVWIDGETIADAGLALSAVGLTTVHASRAEELMRGKAPSEELWDEVARSPRRTARRPRTGAGRSTTSGIWQVSSRSARSGGRSRGLEDRRVDAGHDLDQRRAGHQGDRAGAAAGPLHPRHARADRARTGAATRPTAAPASCRWTGGR